MSLLSLLGLRSSRTTFDWNGHLIDFSAWAPDAYGEYSYTTRDLSCSFTFDLRPSGRVVRIYIISQPSYGHRSADAHSTHRIDARSSRPYVCIRDCYQPTNVPDALSWAIYWAEQTAKYIRTGHPFS